MGGKCFVEPGPNGESALYIPRMSPIVYQAVKIYYSTELRNEHFEEVQVLTEAPEKSSYGDLDILVANAKSGVRAQVFEETSNDMKSLVDCLLPQLHAVRFKYHPSSHLVSFGIPFSSVLEGFSNDGLPAALEERLSTEQKADLATNLTMLACDNAHFQLDLDVCATKSKLRYMNFIMAYGGIADLIALSIRQLSLTFVPDGFALSLDQEMPKRHGKPVRIILTDDVSAILDFLGLDKPAWSQGFKSQHEVFTWITAGRFFSRTSRARDIEKRSSNFRPMIHCFMVDWLPNYPDVGTERQIDRAMVQQEALDRFDKRREFDTILAKHQQSTVEQQFWEKASSLVEPDGRARTIRALRRWVAFEAFHDPDPIPLSAADDLRSDGRERKRFVIRHVAELALDKQPAWTVDSGMTEAELLAWIEANYKSVRRSEKERDEKERETRKSMQLSHLA